MQSIEVDSEVFEYLKKKAEPFVDTPNSVLRRILKIDKEDKPKKENIDLENTSLIETSTRDFVGIVLDKEFTGNFETVQRYQYMFESSSNVVYFQNFNQDSETLWYRVNTKSYKLLKNSSKECYICLTNPSERIAYIIPIHDIEKQINYSNYSRDYLEINIDHISCKWRELNWNIKKYLKHYN